MGIEIITGTERRRRWRLEGKLRIVAEVAAPGACFADVARRYEVSRGLLWYWRDQVRRGVLVAEPPPVFLPVQMVPERAAPDPSSGVVAALQPRPPEAAATATGSTIEIVLLNGAMLCLAEAVGSTVLHCVLAALRR